MSAYVFDSYSLLKVFQKEEGYQPVLRLLKSSRLKNESRLIHIINFAEIIYLVKKRDGNPQKMRVIAAIHEMDLRIVPASDALVYQAAELKGEYPMSFGDCFALATAINHKAILVTGDPEFQAVTHLVKVRWI